MRLACSLRLLAATRRSPPPPPAATPPQFQDSPIDPSAVRFYSVGVNNVLASDNVFFFAGTWVAARPFAAGCRLSGTAPEVNNAN